VLSIFVSGLTLGLSLIVAIGPQNAHVLTTGIKRHGVLTVVALCSFSDIVLILLGVGGLGNVIARSHDVLEAARYLGAAYLVYFAISKFRGAFSAKTLSLETGSKTSLVSTTLALTFLNPHVYLDTVVLLGSVSAHYGAMRWAFAAGAGVGSIVWFSSIGYGARLMAPLASSVKFWKYLDLAVGVIVLAVAANLVMGA
jgi:L-lysine exporter family protein LysE/ArgO